MSYDRQAAAFWGLFADPKCLDRLFAFSQRDQRDDRENNRKEYVQ